MPQDRVLIILLDRHLLLFGLVLGFELQDCIARLLVLSLLLSQKVIQLEQFGLELRDVLLLIPKMFFQPIVMALHLLQHRLELLE